VDRKLVCNAIVLGTVAPVVGVAGLACRSDAACGRPATHDPVFAARRSRGQLAARSGKRHGIGKTTGRKWIEKAPA